MQFLLLLGTWVTLALGSPLHISQNNKTQSHVTTESTTTTTPKTVEKPQEIHEKKKKQDLVDNDNLDKSIEALYKDYYLWKFTVLDPQKGAKWGLLEKPRLNDESLHFLQSANKSCDEFRNRASKFLQDPQISPYHRKYVSILEYETETCVRGFNSRGYFLAPINYLSGIQLHLPSFFIHTLKYRTMDDYKHSLSLLASVPQHTLDIERVLRSGVSNNVTYPIESLQKAKQQFEKITEVEGPTKSPFYAPFARIKSTVTNMTPTQIATIQASAQKAIAEQVTPAFKRLQDYIYGEYSKSLRSKPGLGAQKPGRDLYQACIEYHTSLQGINATTVHNIGLQQVKDLRRQAEQSAVELGSGNMTFAEISQYFRNSSENKFQSGTDTLNTFKKQVVAINDNLPKLFSKATLTKDVFKLQVLPVPKQYSIIAAYSNSRVYINVNDLDLLTPLEVAVTALHEGSPGHHLQFTFAKHQDEAPKFYTSRYRHFNNPSAPAGYSSYIEGWGLYAESLGHQMDGIYDRDNQVFGFYSLSLLRACRLVVDTGIHAFGWSKQEALDYLVENTFQPIASLDQEIDRYITWPGQALSYKMGEMKIKETLRQISTDESFDIKVFHDAVLSCNGPLNHMENCVRTYMKRTHIVDPAPISKDQSASLTTPLLDSSPPNEPVSL